MIPTVYFTVNKTFTYQHAIFKKLMTFNVESGYIFFAKVMFQTKKGCNSFNKFNVDIKSDKDSLL